MKRPTTSEVLTERRRDLARKQREERDAHRSLEPMIRELCDAGLVDDVDPDPNPTPSGLAPVTFHCGICGTVLGGDPLTPCPRCSRP